MITREPDNAWHDSKMANGEPYLEAENDRIAWPEDEAARIRLGTDGCPLCD